VLCVDIEWGRACDSKRKKAPQGQRGMSTKLIHIDFASIGTAI